MIVCVGQAMIDCIVSGGSVNVPADEIVLCPGGEAFNQASVFAVLGDKVCLSAAVGNDHAGNILRNEAERLGFELYTGGFEGRTPVSVLETDETGNRKSRISELHYLGGFVPSLPETETEIEIVTMGSLFRPPFLDPDICLEFAKRAKERGCLLAADTKMPKGAEIRLKDYAELLCLLDYITPNEEEARYYTGKTDPKEAAAVFRSYGVKNAVIKLAEKGCLIDSEKEGFFRLPAFPSETVDAIGAGDTFTAGMFHSLIRGSSLREAALYASACGAVCVSQRGAAPASDLEARVMTLLSHRKEEDGIKHS